MGDEDEDEEEGEARSDEVNVKRMDSSRLIIESTTHQVGRKGGEQDLVSVAGCVVGSCGSRDGFCGGGTDVSLWSPWRGRGGWKTHSSAYW